MLAALSSSARHPRALWLRWLVFSVLMASTPATRNLVEDVVLVLQDACSETGDCDDCDDEPADSDTAPRSCQHCSHCTPSSILPPPVALVVSAALVLELEPVALLEMTASGYRSQPFRPPAA